MNFIAIKPCFSISLAYYAIIFFSTIFMLPYITLMGITLLAAMSPGPDTIVVIKNSLISRKLGILTGFGIASAIFVHVGYCIAGLGVIISQSIIAFQIIKILGVSYILWISYQILSKKTSYSDVHLSKDTSLKLSSFQAFARRIYYECAQPKGNPLLSCGIYASD